MKISVANIQRGCVSDGPGIRTTVFLKGCLLSCPWCCNPETQYGVSSFFIDLGKCVIDKGLKSTFCTECEHIGGRRSMSECPYGVKEKAFKEYSTDELYDEIIHDKKLFDDAHGGVTFSGGEPFLQSKVLFPLIERLKQSNVSICFETALYPISKDMIELLELIDIFIIDLKLQKEVCLPDNYLSTVKPLLWQIQSSGKQLIYRLVFIDSMLNNKDQLLLTLSDLNIQELELLKCHGLGEKKYRLLQLDFVNYSASETSFLDFSHFLQVNGVHVKPYKV